MIGTLRYMSPEQLGGRLIDGRTDVYSLGLTLYELVVGQPAFGESSRESLMREILEVDPPAPRRIRAGVPRDLETIILKAIAKDRDRRYADASEFRDDLERFLDRRPIQARRMSRCGHFISWCRRRPATAVLTLSLASLLFLLSVAGPLLAVRYARLASLARRNLRIADLNRAYDAWYSGNVDETERLLRRHISQDTAPHRTDFALQYLAARLAESQQTVIFRHEKPVTALAVSADGRMVASAGNGGLICLTDIVTQQLIHLTAPVSHVSDLAFSPDGQWLLAGGAPDSLVLWDVPAWQPRMIRTPTRVNVGCIAFAPMVRHWPLDWPMVGSVSGPRAARDDGLRQRIADRCAESHLTLRADRLSRRLPTTEPSRSLMRSPGSRPVSCRCLCRALPSE